MNNPATSSSGFQPTGQLHFGLALVGPAEDMDFQSLRTLAQTAERGQFTFVALDERYWLGGDPGTVSASDPAGSLDVTTLLAALAAITSHIGLVAAAGPGPEGLAGLAHRIASLDSATGGRAAWHLLAAEESWQDDGLGGGGDREAVLDAAQELWARWNGAAAEPARLVEELGQFQHEGHNYTVGLGQVRPSRADYRPVVLLGGGEGADLDFATRQADVILCAPAGLAAALAFRRDVVARTLASGRAAGDVKIFQSATFFLAGTEEEAHAKAAMVREGIPGYAWDAEAFIGSYAQVAEELLDFARSGAVDGFTIMPWLNESELHDIVNHLIPELQRRGIYPTDYVGRPLRRNLGLQLAPAASESRTAVALPVIEVGDLGDVRLEVDFQMELLVQKQHP